MSAWITVIYGDSDEPTRVYINDGGWLGWRPILTRSNLRIANALLTLL